MKIKKMDQMSNEVKASALYQKWTAQAEALRKDFPSFDWESALQSDDFCKALMNGETVYKAYLIKLYNELSPTAQEVVKIIATATEGEVEQMITIMEDKMHIKVAEH